MRAKVAMGSDFPCKRSHRVGLQCRRPDATVAMASYFRACTAYGLTKHRICQHGLGPEWSRTEPDRAQLHAKPKMGPKAYPVE